MKPSVKKTLKEFKQYQSRLMKFQLEEMLREEDFEGDDAEPGKGMSPEFAKAVNKELGDATITNPETETDIKVTSALGYDKSSKVYKLARKQWDKAVEKVSKDMKKGSGEAPSQEPEKEDPGKLSGDDFASDAEKEQSPQEPEVPTDEPDDEQSNDNSDKESEEDKMDNVANSITTGNRIDNDDPYINTLQDYYDGYEEDDPIAVDMIDDYINSLGYDQRENPEEWREAQAELMKTLERRKKTTESVRFSKRLLERAGIRKKYLK